LTLYFSCTRGIKNEHERNRTTQGAATTADLLPQQQPQMKDVNKSLPLLLQMRRDWLQATQRLDCRPRESLKRRGKDSLTIGLFDGDPSCRFCGMETETVQHLVCHCEALSRQCYNVSGELIMEPKDLCTATVRDLCLFIRKTGLSKLG
jgi:hypothetical protein